MRWEDINTPPPVVRENRFCKFCVKLVLLRMKHSYYFLSSVSHIKNLYYFSPLSQNMDLSDTNAIIDSNSGTMHVSSGYIPNGGLAEELNCAYSPQNGDFVNLFTPGDQNVSTLYNTDNELDTTLSVIYQSSQPSADSNVLLQQSDIQRLDSELNNIPKELYTQKLLQITANNESMIAWYRNTMSSRAKVLEGCPSGNMINRKTTNRSTRAEKLSKDCFALHNFINGSKAGIEEVYDKSKPSSDIPKVAAIDQKVLMQTLLERVSSLEKSDAQKDKTIESLKTDIKSLRS